MQFVFSHDKISHMMEQRNNLDITSQQQDQEVQPQAASSRKKITLIVVSILTLLAVITGIIWLVVATMTPPTERVYTSLTHLAEKQERPFVELSYGDLSWDVLVSRSYDELTRGLGYLESMDEDQGMIFVFPESGKHGFWAKGMQFDFDIVWLDTDGRVVDVVSNISPESYPTVFEPQAEAVYVLELVAGQATMAEITAGEYIELPEGLTNI
jgi:uncharacterized membrane protein (UPF0127 family)